MSPNAATNDHGGWALFLDVDGTILEIAETPRDVCVPKNLKQLLNEVCLHLDGALALISGRVHGCERRAAGGYTFRPELDTRAARAGAQSPRRLCA